MLRTRQELVDVGFGIPFANKKYYIVVILSANGIVETLNRNRTDYGISEGLKMFPLHKTDEVTSTHTKVVLCANIFGA